MKIAAIIAARTRSTRLPGKIFKDIEGKPMLQHVIERVKRAKTLDEVIIATTDSDEDRGVSELAKVIGVDCVQGSEQDVLSRFVLAQGKTGADIIVRVTSDFPLADPKTIDRAVNEFLEAKVDYIGNLATRSFPRGLDVEAFSKETLKKADQLGMEKRHREHVTTFIYENPEIFKIAQLIAEGILRRPDIRLCIDTEEDLLLIRKIYRELYNGKIIDIIDVINFLNKNPELIEINRKSELEHLERNKKAGIKQEFIN